MKICAVSDLHGFLPDIPECDLLLIAGDICPAINHGIPFQEGWLDVNFRFWLKNIPAKKIVYIAGNHDWIFQLAPHRIPKDLPATYLQDSHCYFEDLKIYGTPWQPYFFDWAFNLYENDLKEKWAKIPADTDILVLHGPPKGFGDLAPRIIKDEDEEKWPSGEHTGSISLLEKIDEVKPKLAVFGHIHEGRGQWKWGDTILANVTVVNSKYENIHKPWVVEL